MPGFSGLFLKEVFFSGVLGVCLFETFDTLALVNSFSCFNKLQHGRVKCRGCCYTPAGLFSIGWDCRVFVRTPKGRKTYGLWQQTHEPVDV